MSGIGILSIFVSARTGYVDAEIVVWISLPTYKTTRHTQHTLTDISPNQNSSSRQSNLGECDLSFFPTPPKARKQKSSPRSIGGTTFQRHEFRAPCGQRTCTLAGMSHDNRNAVSSGWLRATSNLLVHMWLAAHRRRGCQVVLVYLMGRYLKCQHYSILSNQLHPVNLMYNLTDVLYSTYNVPVC
jgi:hypothetical protein